MASIGPYDRAFYETLAAGTAKSARRVMPIVLGWVTPVSVVDFGCGEGVWLRAVADLGVTDYLGLDGPHIVPSRLAIPRERFRAMSLAGPVDLGRVFDLALCLEVAEHLPESSADPLVATLCTSAPVVLFSAAVPHQGGVGHLNEQWPDYWSARFASQGFECFDVLRRQLWSDQTVDWYYRQNLLLFVRKSSLSRYPALLTTGTPTRPDRLVHPVLFEATIDRLDVEMETLRAERAAQDHPGIRRASIALLRALVQRIRPHTPALREANGAAGKPSRVGTGLGENHARKRDGS